MTKRKRLTLVALAATTLAVTACTPEQVATIERIYGVDFTPAETRELVAAPDLRIKTPLGWVEADGTISPYVAPAGSRCPQWFGAVMLAGWPEADWPKVDTIIWGESRCIPTVHTNASDGYIFRNDDSYSLFQINMKAHRSWVLPLIGGDVTRLYDPVTNAWIARRLYEKAVDYYGCGWRPWSTRDRRWC